jgi:Nucleotidyl transferase AbiEii toxin, Type IV TA system
MRPHLEVLPPGQKGLWPQLARTRELGFVLYGGTAVALRLGHRSSVDFDFFSARPLDKDAIRRVLPFARKATVLQDEKDTLTLDACVEGDSRPVKIAFFGNLDFGRVGEPSVTDDGVVIASLDDLMATKLKVVLQRVESKDYRDVAALLKAGVSLSRGLAAAESMFKPAFQPSECLKALAYFRGGDLDSLAEADRNTLMQAVRSVRDLPEVELLSRRLEAAELGAGRGPRERDSGMEM